MPIFVKLDLNVLTNHKASIPSIQPSDPLFPVHKAKSVPGIDIPFGNHPWPLTLRLDPPHNRYKRVSQTSECKFFSEICERSGSREEQEGTHSQTYVLGRVHKDPVEPILYVTSLHAYISVYDVWRKVSRER